MNATQKYDDDEGAKHPHRQLHATKESMEVCLPCGDGTTERFTEVIWRTD